MSKYPFDINCGGAVIIVGDQVDGVILSPETDCVFVEGEKMRNIFLFGL